MSITLIFSHRQFLIIPFLPYPILSILNYPFRLHRLRTFMLTSFVSPQLVLLCLCEICINKVGVLIAFINAFDVRIINIFINISGLGGT